MSRYIDADKLVAHLKDEIEGCKPPVGGRANGRSVAYGTELGLKMAVSFAETLPAENVVSFAEYDSMQARLEVNKIMKRKLEKALEKAEHDRDRYARKIAELEEHQIADMEMFKTLRADTARDIQTRVAVHFGTYTDKDVVKVADVFKLINQIALEILEADEE